MKDVYCKLQEDLQFSFSFVYLFLISSGVKHMLGSYDANSNLKSLMQTIMSAFCSNYLSLPQLPIR